MSVPAGSPINVWIFYILAFFLTFSNAAQQQALRAATVPKRVAVIGRQFSMSSGGPYDPILRS
jgi:predicted NAD-dependent protein-ADP-ribosyltransferase YbiA (DUF1768 family)